MLQPLPHLSGVLGSTVQCAEYIFIRVVGKGDLLGKRIMKGISFYGCVLLLPHHKIKLKFNISRLHFLNGTR